ncbi:MAG: hypothetical protein IKJ65_06550 [Clostridia bacterium]|nr:hypothetical protein [Clostridia bacterium]
MYNQEALLQAMSVLKGSGLKMWLYINKNQDGYRFELSRQACAEWGIKKDSYYDGFNDLVNKGYLRLSQPGSNIYYFYENALAENPTSGYSEFYFTEKTKPAPGFQNTKYEIQKGYTEKPERNNIYNTGILQDNTSSVKPENDDDYWAELERQEEKEARKRTWASYKNDLGF